MFPQVDCLRWRIAFPGWGVALKLMQAATFGQTLKLLTLLKRVRLRVGVESIIPRLSALGHDRLFSNKRSSMVPLSAPRLETKIRLQDGDRTAIVRLFV